MASFLNPAEWSMRNFNPVSTSIDGGVDRAFNKLNYMIEEFSSSIFHASRALKKK